MTYDIIETNPQYYTTSGVLYMKKYKSFFFIKKKFKINLNIYCVRSRLVLINFDIIDL